MEYENSAISSAEWASAWDVFSQYPAISRPAFVERMESRARDTRMPFRAYDVAHAVCGKLADTIEKEN